MDLKNILENFNISGDFVHCEPFGNGLINTTYTATFSENGNTKRYILQKINSHLFTNVDGLMNNIKLVTEFMKAEIIKRNGDPMRETLTIINTKNGKPYFKAEDNSYYRVYPFIEGTTAYDTVSNPKHFYESGRAFGNFAYLLDKFDASLLYPVLPDFHNTKKRFATFKKSLDADKFKRSAEVMEEIEFALSNEKLASLIVDLLDSKKMPERVTHNDTKLNNVLIDNKTGKAICVIDLDTMISGSICYDFGDSIRFGCNPVPEDSKELDKVIFNVPLFQEYAKGYVSSVKHIITDIEKENLVTGAILMTYECGMRFLTDYLDGDVYFKTTREKQNIDRCRTQFKLVKDMLKIKDDLQDIIAKI